MAIGRLFLRRGPTVFLDGSRPSAGGDDVAGDEGGDVGFPEENLPADLHESDFASGLESVESANGDGDSTRCLAASVKERSDVSQRPCGAARVGRWLAV